jgi:hypothetical protein
MVLGPIDKGIAEDAVPEVTVVPFTVTEAVVWYISGFLISSSYWRSDFGR